ncbi:MAG: hypothetical protein WBA12_03150 [Catalinimonas sp.]
MKYAFITFVLLIFTATAYAQPFAGRSSLRQFSGGAHVGGMVGGQSGSAGWTAGGFASYRLRPAWSVLGEISYVRYYHDLLPEVKQDLFQYRERVRVPVMLETHVRRLFFFQGGAFADYQLRDYQQTDVSVPFAPGSPATNVRRGGGVDAGVVAGVGIISEAMRLNLRYVRTLTDDQPGYVQLHVGVALW